MLGGEHSRLAPASGHARSMLRHLMILLLMLGSAPVIWLREPRLTENFSQTVILRGLSLPSARLGPFAVPAPGS